MSKFSFISELAEQLDEARYEIDSWDEDDTRAIIYLLQQLQDELDVILAEY